MLLTLTLSSPKSHRLTFMRSQAEQLASTLTRVWPRTSKFERRCFELLVRAYVDARYSPHYAITADELNWLLAGVTNLQSDVERLCREFIAIGRERETATG